MPVRLTILNRDSRERVFRVFGVLAGVRASVLTVDCVRSVPSFAEGEPVSVEVLANGNVAWFHSTLSTVVKPSTRGQVYLQLPESVETLQRRRHPRVDVDIPVRLVLKRTGVSLAVRARDLSGGGAALQMAEPISAGEEVRLEFPRETGLSFGNLEAETLRCIDGPSGSYTVAVRFHSTPEQEAHIALWVNRRLDEEAKENHRVLRADLM